VGRHGLLCFGDEYELVTRRDGKESRATIATSRETTPFIFKRLVVDKCRGHGTELSVVVERNLPSPDEVRTIISARFIHDPRFAVTVNGASLRLTEHSGLTGSAVFEIGEDASAEAYLLDSTHAARSTIHQGVAIWVAGRLVGEPGWQLGSQTLLDGRTRLAKQYTAIVKADALLEDVMPDWTGLKETSRVARFYECASRKLRSMLASVAAGRVEETKAEVVEEIRNDLGGLAPLRRHAVREFIDDLAKDQPFMPPDTMSAAARAFINLEKARSGEALMEKLATLSADDIEGLNRLLGEWSVAEALTVLDVIDHRIAVLEAIRRFSENAETRELETLHPLVAEARWLFGPEFDSSEYSSNATLMSIVESVFGGRREQVEFTNGRRRPDLIVLKDASVCLCGVDHYDSVAGVARLRDVLIIEIKRGRSTIGRDEMRQAQDYVEEILSCGILGTETPAVRAFVVGHEIASNVLAVEIAERRASIRAATYTQLVRTGQARLHGLKARLESRYEEMPIGRLEKSVERLFPQVSIVFPED
jgi:hypothetical protein